MGVREALLALLGEGPAYGYQLKAAFEAATGKVWPLNVGQVYTTLERLDRDGLVATEEDDGQRSYRLTSGGMAELGAWWEAGPIEEPPPRDELMLKVLLAVSVGREHALEVVTNQRNALMELLQQRRRNYRKRPPSVDPLISQMVIDVLLMRAEADLRWLDLCEERLTSDPRAFAEDAENAENHDNGRRRGRARRGGRS